MSVPGNPAPSAPSLPETEVVADGLSLARETATHEGRTYLGLRESRDGSSAPSGGPASASCWRSSPGRAWPATKLSTAFIEPADIGHPAALAAGALGFVGNWIAALIRTGAGKRLGSSALIADGAHARADAYVSLAVITSAASVAVGLPIADPLIGLVITAAILRIT